MDLNTDIKFIQSPNYNRYPPIVPKLIVVHWTAGSYKSAVSWFQRPESQVSAHFVINKDGTDITQMVALHNRAWHAGRSYHPLVGNNVNSYSIGIELEGPPSYVGLSSTGWNTNQLNLLWELCILIKYKVPTIVGITDHSTILPTMKTDVLAGTGINKLSFDIWEAGIEYTKLENMSTKVIRDQIRAYFKLV